MKGILPIDLAEGISFHDGWVCHRIAAVYKEHCIISDCNEETHLRGFSIKATIALLESAKVVSFPWGHRLYD